MEPYHEVEPSHQEHKVNQEQPVLLESDLAFGDECAGYASIRMSNGISLTVGLGLWQAETERNNQNWWASSEPEKRSPAMRCGVNQPSGEDRR